RQIDTFIEEQGLTSRLETNLDTEQLKINISDSALFDPGSATVKPGSLEVARTISDVLLQAQEYQIVISGHTDNVPINTREFPSNWDLSLKRAANFLYILLENDQLAQDRFVVSGYGEQRPIADNDTAEGRAKNRRVEVSIMRNFQLNTNGAANSGCFFFNHRTTPIYLLLYIHNTVYSVISSA